MALVWTSSVSSPFSPPSLTQQHLHLSLSPGLHGSFFTAVPIISRLQPVGSSLSPPPAAPPDPLHHYLITRLFLTECVLWSADSAIFQGPHTPNWLPPSSGDLTSTRKDSLNIRTRKADWDRGEMKGRSWLCWGSLSYGRGCCRDEGGAEGCENQEAWKSLVRVWEQRWWLQWSAGAGQRLQRATVSWILQHRSKRKKNRVLPWLRSCLLPRFFGNSFLSSHSLLSCQLTNFICWAAVIDKPWANKLLDLSSFQLVSPSQVFHDGCFYPLLLVLQHHLAF